MSFTAGNLRKQLLQPLLRDSLIRTPARAVQPLMEFPQGDRVDHAGTRDLDLQSRRRSRRTAVLPKCAHCQRRRFVKRLCAHLCRMHNTFGVRERYLARLARHADEDTIFALSSPVAGSSSPGERRPVQTRRSRGPKSYGPKITWATPKVHHREASHARFTK